MNPRLILFIIATVFVSSNIIAQEHHHATEDKTDSLPVVLIMQGMDKSLSQLSSAIMYEDYERISLSAHNIANHPAINKEDIDALFKRLGPKKAAFIKCDTEVHDLAVAIAKAGKNNNMGKILENYSAMLVKAAECHSNFR